MRSSDVNLDTGSSWRRSSWLALLVAVVVLLAPLAHVIDGVQAQSDEPPTLVLSREQVEAGADIDVTGTGFAARARGELTLQPGGTVLRSFRTSRDGSFTKTVRVPTDATGEVTVVATVGDETAEAALRVVAEQRMPSEEPQPTETVETPPPAATEEPTSDAPSPTRTPRPKHRRTPTPTVEPTEDRQEEDSVPSTVLPSGDEDAGFEAAAAATTLSPRADARVAQSNPNTNYGRSTQVRVDGGGDPEVMSYLRFDVPSVGSVSSAKLRLWVTDGTADGPGVRLAGNQWTESGITWNKRPAPTGALVADLGRISSGGWAEFDVTSLVQAPGAYTFAIVATSTDGANFASREDSSTSRRPRLVITTGGSANPTPAPTKTPTP
ncbi:MAG: hypothetical protein QOF33_543, partial [Thermomicrobiales bacterium]|nr:hypothetical protein [Thermomicrobiales bacterium]